MGVFPYLVWGCGEFLLAGLILRSQKIGLFSRYRYFCSYVLSVFCSGLIKICLALSKANAQVFARASWSLEFVTVLLGFGVTWEILRQTLLPYPGVRKMARAVLLLVFAAILLNALIELSDNPIRNLVPTTRELDRNLRVVQAVFLMALAGLVVHYRIPLGRNMWSMLIGYGLMVGTGVITFTLSARFDQVAWKWWALPIQLEYCASLAIWCAGMWSYAPVPSPGSALERDYQRISAQTVRAFSRLREHVIQPWSD